MAVLIIKLGEFLMIKKATKKEQEFILSKALDCALESIPNGKNITEEKVSMFIMSVFRNGGYYLVHKDQFGKMTGWILVGRDFDYFSGDKIGFLFELYVMPKYRYKGIAKLLLNGAIDDLKNQGLYEVRLNVYAGNNAKSIYKKLGFKEVNTIMYKKV